MEDVDVIQVLANALNTAGCTSFVLDEWVYAQTPTGTKWSFSFPKLYSMQTPQEMAQREAVEVWEKEREEEKKQAAAHALLLKEQARQKLCSDTMFACSYCKKETQCVEGKHAINYVKDLDDPTVFICAYCRVVRHLEGATAGCWVEKAGPSARTRHLPDDYRNITTYFNRLAIDYQQQKRR
jgi:hypothetical protein